MSVGSSLICRVSGVTYPQMKIGGYGNEPETIVKAYRNTTGLMIVDKVCTKRKIFMEFDILTGAQYSIIYQAHKNFTNLPVYCWDPDTRSYRTYNCYPNTVTGRMVIPPPNEYWRDIAIHFIEH